jgi:hypothetical protein
VTLLWRLWSFISGNRVAQFFLAAVGVKAWLEVDRAKQRRKAVSEAEAKRERDAAWWAKNMLDRVRENEGALTDEQADPDERRTRALDFLRKRGLVRKDPPG